LGPQVVVEERCKLDHCVFLGADRNEFRNNTITRKYTTHIGKDSRLSYVILDKNVWIGEGVEISPDNGTPEQRGEILKSIGLKPYKEIENGAVEGDFYIEPEMGILVIGKQYGTDPRKPIIPHGLKC
jgi:ADP-glucose pyrophosphorylase